MIDEHFLDPVPVWAFFVFMTLVALVPIEVGQRSGVRRRRKVDHEPEGPVGSVVGATLALLGFMVALTLGAATARFDARKEVLIDGVNAIETAYRNASLLPEPHNSETRRQLLEYVEMRRDLPNLYSKSDELRKLDTRIRALQRTLWSHAEALAKEDRSSETYAMFTSSINEVIQVHNKRVIIGALHRIPSLVWVVLVIVTIITMFGVGFQFGLTGNRSLISNLMLALTFSLVMALIFDLEQPGKGWVGVSQKPMHDLYDRLRAQE